MINKNWGNSESAALAQDVNRLANDVITPTIFLDVSFFAPVRMKSFLKSKFTQTLFEAFSGECDSMMIRR